MNKIASLLHFLLSNTLGFVTVNQTIATQYHVDEKRNVKQPPHLIVTKNYFTGFYNLMIPISNLS